MSRDPVHCAGRRCWFSRVQRYCLPLGTPVQLSAAISLCHRAIPRLARLTCQRVCKFINVCGIAIRLPWFAVSGLMRSMKPAAAKRRRVSRDGAKRRHRASAWLYARWRWSGPRGSSSTFVYSLHKVYTLGKGYVFRRQGQ